MPSLSPAALHCLFLLLTACCQTSQASDFDLFNQHVIDSELGGESFHSELQRQKRNVPTFYPPPLEYTIDIEVSFTDLSFLGAVKQYYKYLSLPDSKNISGVEMTVSSINITTVCLHSSKNESCCSCESGYAWPSVMCNDLITCPSVSLAPGQPCGYIREMPFYGPYCEPETGDSCGMGEPIVVNMSVRLDKDFNDDLRNSSSKLYKEYKADLEKAFNFSYRCLPGFVSATATGFSPGSVLVSYNIKAAAASFSQIGHSNRFVPYFLDATYQLIPSSFTTEITNQTNFTVSPVDIFEGDTVRLMCEINTAADGVTWYQSNQTLNSSRHSLESQVTTGMSRSILTIINVTTEDSGFYTCTFVNSSPYHTLVYKGMRRIAVSSLHIISYSNDSTIICNSPDTQAKSTLLFCCIDRYSPSFTSHWKVNGEINITGVSSFDNNCTEYKLNITESLCLPEKSGTVTTYTCELQTGHGARSSQNIRVTYFRSAHVRISSSVSTSVSEGYGFNLTCKSDERNYDSISWEIQSGDKIQTVECAGCIRTNKSTATSVLTVDLATWEWNGTYFCTFFYKPLTSSANVTVVVNSLPLKQNILLDPIKAPIQCKTPQVLKCCISANTTEDYTVEFVVQEKEFRVEKKKQENILCYLYNYTETECGKEKELTAYCRFINRAGHEVKSESIQLTLIPDNEISCSANNTFGREGDTLIKPCPLLNKSFIQGKVIYKCFDKSWKTEGNSCLSEQINNLLIRAETLVNSPNAKTGLPNFLQNIRNETELQQNDNSSANLGAIVTILYYISAIPADAKESIINDFFSTVDIIVAGSKTELWANLNKEETPKSSLLLNSVERFSENLQPVNNTIPHLVTKTLEIQGMVVTGNSSADYYKNFSSLGNLRANVLITKTETLPPNSTIVSVAYSALGHILPEKHNMYVNSLVMTTTLSCKRIQSIHITMTFQKANLSLKTPLCVFWNFSLNKSRGGWDSHGCTPTEEEGNIICSCNHLTPFSILMSQDQPSNNSVADCITHIGLAISILSLVACIIIESLVWKNVTNNTTSYMRHVCMLNIATSLLVADIWFVVTAFISDQNIKKRGDICIVATFFIHLFYLCGFFWMLSLGLILFYRLVFIFHNTSKTTQKAVAFCLGYGCPFVFAVTTIAVTLPQNSYTRKNVCWLNWTDSKALLAFVIPVLVIVAVNLFITGIVIIKILRPNIGDKTNKQERKTLFQIGKSLAILTPLLGLTWVFGIGTITKNSHQAFHILFALFNALQGLFILVFGTLWDKKITEALLTKNSLTRWSSQQTKSTSLILVTPMFSMSYPFSRTFNNLRGKTGKYRVSSSEPSSSSENTSKSYSLLN
ncbi:AGRF5 protein, partial [Anseranas semipalmata]|nr:AGRF5 protein [Anseranas semipalmata]